MQHVRTILVGAAALTAAGCSALLSDPGGYYLADGGPSNQPPEASSEAAPEAETGSGDDAGGSENDAGDEAGDDAGSVPDVATDAGNDGPKCHSTQILQPAQGATVSSPVHLVTTWEPCMTAIICYMDGPNTSNEVGTTMSQTDAGIGIDKMLNIAPGMHYLACSTFYASGGGSQTPSDIITVVGDASPD